jgi:hypothetical protein
MMADHDGGQTPGRSGAPVDLREGVPDERLASRELRIVGGVEVAQTRYLPNEMEVPPLKGYTVNLRLGGTGRVVTRFGGMAREGPLVAGLVEVFTGVEPLEWALEGSISENVNVLLGRDFVAKVAAESGADRVEVLDALNADDHRAGRILGLFLDEIRTGGWGANCTPGVWRPPSLSTSCANIPRWARRPGGGSSATRAFSPRPP